LCGQQVHETTPMGPMTTLRILKATTTTMVCKMFDHRLHYCPSGGSTSIFGSCRARSGASSAQCGSTVGGEIVSLVMHIRIYILNIFINAISSKHHKEIARGRELAVVPAIKGPTTKSLGMSPTRGERLATVCRVGWPPERHPGVDRGRKVQDQFRHCP